MPGKPRSRQQIGKLSRERGKIFERKVVNAFKEAFPAATIHRSSQADHAYDSDVTIKGDAPYFVRDLWLECENSMHPTPLKKLAQAERDVERHRERTGKQRMPVVVWQKKRAKVINVTVALSNLNELCLCRTPTIFETVITLTLEDFLHILTTKAELKPRNPDALLEKKTPTNTPTPDTSGAN